MSETLIVIEEDSPTVVEEVVSPVVVEELVQVIDVTTPGIQGAKGDKGDQGDFGPTSPSFSKTGALAPLVGQFRWYNDTGVTLTIAWVRAGVGTVADDDIIVDVNKEGVTVFTDQNKRPTIPAGEQAVKVADIDVTSVEDGKYITIDIDQAGNALPGENLTVTVGLSVG